MLKVTAPPLRERVEDLPLLVSHFIKKHGPKNGAAPHLSEEAFEVMRRYNWPGNIRELENEIERLMVLSSGSDDVPASLLSPRIREAVAPEVAAVRQVPGFDFESGKFGSLREMVESVESEVIAQGLIRTHWNKSQLAKELGISRSNLIQKCTYYGLDGKR